MLVFEWDAEKARQNEQKHGVPFVEAAEVFHDDHSSTVSDPGHSIDEGRYLTFGISKQAGIWLCPILSAGTGYVSFPPGK